MCGRESIATRVEDMLSTLGVTRALAEAGEKTLPLVWVEYHRLFDGDRRGASRDPKRGHECHDWALGRIRAGRLHRRRKWGTSEERLWHIQRSDRPCRLALRECCRPRVPFRADHGNAASSGESVLQSNLLHDLLCHVGRKWWSSGAGCYQEKGSPSLDSIQCSKLQVCTGPNISISHIAACGLMIR